MRLFNRKCREVPCTRGLVRLRTCRGEFCLLALGDQPRMLTFSSNHFELPPACLPARRISAKSGCNNEVRRTAGVNSGGPSRVCVWMPSACVCEVSFPCLEVFARWFLSLKLRITAFFFLRPDLFVSDDSRWFKCYPFRQTYVS